MAVSRIVLSTLLCSMLLACGAGTELLLSVDRTDITAGGIDFAVLTAILGRNGNLLAGQTLQFETNSGSFSESEELQDTQVSTDADGRAQVKLYSSKAAGTANVIVTFEDLVSDVTAVASISVRFGKPTGSSIPLAETVRLDCQAANIGALRAPIPDIRVSCSLTAQTIDGRTIPLSALDPLLFAEAGTLQKETDENTDELVLVYTPRGGAAAPVDVAPVQQIGEPGYQGAGNTVFNPRDGLVTLMAVVDAQETFLDQNGNGIYDEGELFMDSPEPFLDVDDNGQAGPAERFVDADGNGVWDAGNQTWDRQAKVMAIYKILWTGPLANDASGQNPASSRIIADTPQGTTIKVSAIAVDRNLNPVAGFADNFDELFWTVEGDGVDTVSPTEVPIRNTYGFSFDTNPPADLYPELGRWRPMGGTFSPEPYNLVLKADPNQDPATFGVVVSAEVTVSPGPRGADDFVEQITERIEHTLTIGQ